MGLSRLPEPVDRRDPRAPGALGGADPDRDVLQDVTLTIAPGEIEGLDVRLLRPEEQRAALSLVVLEGLSYAQAAEVLETPIGTIMSRIARARAALSKALRAESPQTSAGLATGAG